MAKKIVRFFKEVLAFILSPLLILLLIWLPGSNVLPIWHGFLPWFYKDSWPRDWRMVLFALVYAAAETWVFFWFVAYFLDERCGWIWWAAVYGVCAIYAVSCDKEYLRVKARLDEKFGKDDGKTV